MGTVSSTNEQFIKNDNNNNLESFALLWLDAQVDTSEENQQAQKHLRTIINYLKTFDDVNDCQQYIFSISPHDRIVLIVSGQLGQIIVPQIHHLRQIISIYIYCIDKQMNSQWSKQFTKVTAVTVQLNDLITRIRQDQQTRIKVEEPLSYNIYSTHQNLDHTTSSLNGHFLHSLLLIDVLLRMKPNQTDKQQLITLFNNEYKGNSTQLRLVHEFQTKYSSTKALWWYTRESFLYKILNKALRTQNIDVLFLCRFIIRDIYEQLKQNQCQSFLRVYRGQVMSTEEINNLRNSVTNFISINSFFSTSKSQQKALGFLYRTEISEDYHRVLFQIDANANLMSSKPFADISQYSAHRNEEEVLFMIGSVFRLIDVYKNNENQLWMVRMKLCSDDEHDMKKLFEHMKQDYGGGNDQVDILAFGRVLRRMGKYELAEKFYRRLLHDLSSNDKTLCDLYYSLGVVLMDIGDYDSSLEWLYKSLEILIRTQSSDSVNIGSRYCCIGVLYSKKNDYQQALEWYKKGIELFERTNKSDHLSVAHFYNNMALVYDEQKKYSKALKYYRQALAIYEKHLPPDHSDIGTAHDNMGIIYRSLDQYDLAMDCHKQSLEIRLKSLPADHPLLALNYRNIGLVYEKKNELKESFIYLQKAATIYSKSLSSQHPDVKKIEHDLQRISLKLQ